MNYLDIIIAILLILSAFNGFSKGFVIELTSLVALIAGLFAAVYFSDVTADFLTSYFSVSSKYLSIIAFTLTFILVLIAVVFVGRIVEKFVDMLMLGFLNKLAGLVFGVVKGALIISVLIFVINHFDTGKAWLGEKASKGSMLYQYVEPIAPTIYKKLNLPEDIKITVPVGDDIKTLI
jgi:membrane protein required for colicin V production